MHKYVGIPFKDRESSFEFADCYGLVRLVYKHELGVNIPQPSSSAFASKGIMKEYLREISENWFSVDTPQPFDVVAMAHGPAHPRIIQHFGIVLNDTQLLHTLDKVGSHIVNISDYKHFIKGYYRHGKVTHI